MLKFKQLFCEIKNNKKIILILFLVITLKIVLMDRQATDSSNYLYLLGESFKLYENFFDFTYNAILNFGLLFISIKIFNIGIRKNSEFILLRISKFKYVINSFLNILVTKFIMIVAISVYIFIVSKFISVNISINLIDFTKIILFKSVLDYFMITLQVIIGELYFIPYIIIYTIPVTITMVVYIGDYFRPFFTSTYDLSALIIIAISSLLILAKIISIRLLNYIKKVEG